MSVTWLLELCPEIEEWQAEIIAEHVEQRVIAEREACAREALDYPTATFSSLHLKQSIARAIRAREETP
jgi:hypothetical protein